MARASGCSSRMTNHISGGRSRLPVRPMRCRKEDTVKGASIWNARSRRPMSIPNSSVAVVTVVKYAPVALAKPDDYEARANLMWASSWALNGFLYDGNMFAQPAICHNIEHELSAFYDITHGHGLAIVTPRWLRYILSEKTAPRIKRFGVKIMGIDEKLPLMEGASAAVDALEKFFFDTLGLPGRLRDLGIDDKNFAIMAKKACGPEGQLNGMTLLKPEDIVAIFKMCL